MDAGVAAAVVHTTGINWQSVGTIAGSVLASVGGAAKYVASRVEKSRKAAQDQTEKFVGDQVGQVAGILDVKLSQISATLRKQDEAQRQIAVQMSDVRDRTARIEGQLRR
jgi:hypothetical protein